ncbi:MAG: tripartite tricarboxylate transporter permease [Spirochaetales bacterium]|jgi:putative tricarboxylic transport membrane protein|nr:tripartite tricarboxylate transporter permease [Spirochaetales bacterium]
MHPAFEALGFFVDPLGIAMLFAGGFLGTLFSAIPGLTGTMALAIILPLTYALPKEAAFILMVGMLGGTLYGGCLTAISINIPGAPGSVCTTLDGHPMFKKGKGAEAIGWATFASFVGGTLSGLLLFFCAPQLAKFAIKFGAPEFFTLCIFGMVAVITLADDLVKSFVSALFGLLLSTIGGDLFGILRFTYGTRFLLSGVPIVPVVVGTFAISLVLREVNERRAVQENAELYLETARNYKQMKMPPLNEIIPRIPLMLRCVLMGTFIGFLPGAGGNIAAFVSYNVEKKISKHPEEFGTGIIDGIAAPETANNATVGGILIPTLVLGIPGDQFTAVMLGAFLIHGLPVGPLLFRENPVFLYVVFWTAIFTNVTMVIYGILGGRFFVKAAALRKSILIPLIAIVSLTGCFAATNQISAIGLGIVFSIIGFLFNRYKYPFAPLILGLTLGSIIENSLLQSLQMNQNGMMIFLERPASLLFVILSLIFILTTFIKPGDIIKRMAEKSAAQKRLSKNQ